MNKKILIHFLTLLVIISKIQCSSIEPCLSSQKINISQAYAPEIVLPISCLCSPEDVICFSSASKPKFPTLSVLFQQENSSIYYILPKQRFSFYGFDKLEPYAFTDVKFVYKDINVDNFNNQSLFFDFVDISNFSSNSFSNFGNLASIDRGKLPKIFITINSSKSLNFEIDSISNMRIEYMTISTTGKSIFSLEAFNRTSFEKLEIKKSPNFLGFSSKENPFEIKVKTLFIDECLNFDPRTLPYFNELTDLSLKSNNISEIQSLIWSNFSMLRSLSLSNNRIEYVESFQGLEENLEYLDLSFNPLYLFDWKILRNFNKLNKLELSFTSIKNFDSFEREWPKGLKSLSLKGYQFNNYSICTFQNDVLVNKIDLTEVLIELDRDFECNCFLFYILKDYRLKNNLNEWILNNKVPLCYELLYTKANNFLEIEERENLCNFNEIIEDNCPRDITVTTLEPYTTTLTTQQGYNTITIGKLTTFQMDTSSLGLRTKETSAETTISRNQFVSSDLYTNKDSSKPYIEITEITETKSKSPIFVTEKSSSSNPILTTTSIINEVDLKSRTQMVFKTTGVPNQFSNGNKIDLKNDKNELDTKTITLISILSTMSMIKKTNWRRDGIDDFVYFSKEPNNLEKITSESETLNLEKSDELVNQNDKFIRPDEESDFMTTGRQDFAIRSHYKKIFCIFLILF
ncbi:unnamed protein product [Brachionus calyciflorus]|uniref:Uncharacterized protein n=1 Tax=Brachionus calyciflorus TaxID=104777 RepID=A0A814A1U5_9BILA|nr:unnamed protein product [Brachionus calyciflorus]